MPEFRVPGGDKAPQRIYLQWYPESDISNEEGREIEMSEHEPTWRIDRTWDSDIEYVRAEHLPELVEAARQVLAVTPSGRGSRARQKLGAAIAKATGEEQA